MANKTDSVKSYVKSYGMANIFSTHTLPDTFTIKIESLFIERRIFQEQAPPQVGDQVPLFFDLIITAVFIILNFILSDLMQNPLKRQLEVKFDEMLAIAQKPRIYTVDEMQELSMEGLLTIIDRAKEVCDVTFNNHDQRVTL